MREVLFVRSKLEKNFGFVWSSCSLVKRLVMKEKWERGSTTFTGTNDSTPLDMFSGA